MATSRKEKTRVSVGPRMMWDALARACDFTSGASRRSASALRLREVDAPRKFTRAPWGVSSLIVKSASYAAFSESSVVPVRGRRSCSGVFVCWRQTQHTAASWTVPLMIAPFITLRRDQELDPYHEAKVTVPLRPPFYLLLWSRFEKPV